MNFDREWKEMQKNIKEMKEEIKQLKKENSILKIKNKYIENLGEFEDYIIKNEPLKLFEIYYNENFDFEILGEYKERVAEYKNYGLYISTLSMDKQGKNCILIFTRKYEIIDRLYI